MSLDLNQCRSLCYRCVKQYIAKHKLKKGSGGFEIFGCEGVPTQYVPDDILSSLGEDPETIESMVNPVLWANKFLDWHCLDPDGKIWERKTKEGSLGGLPEFDPSRADGKSIFHRPYQVEMLQCSSKRKLFRIGRQSG